MSNCLANSASVLSPRTAAKATFALKAGVWFRRGRLVIVSPVRHISWPISGRNSTYPAAQISRASSHPNRQQSPFEAEGLPPRPPRHRHQVPRQLPALVPSRRPSGRSNSTLLPRRRYRHLNVNTFANKAFAFDGPRIMPAPAAVGRAGGDLDEDRG